MNNYIIDSEGKKRAATEITCTYCQKNFLKQNRQINPENNFCNRECYKLYSQQNKKKVTLTCSYCLGKFTDVPSRVDSSKHGIYFCCRLHKDLGQKIENNISEIWPSHYNNLQKVDINSRNGTTSNYRTIALRHYENKCCKCGIDDFLVLEVHHKDRNRENNVLDNLAILCANCHTKEHKLNGARHS